MPNRKNFLHRAVSKPPRPVGHVSSAEFSLRAAAVPIRSELYRQLSGSQKPATWCHQRQSLANRACEFLLRATLPTKETFSLKRRQWRRRGKGVPWASFLATLLSIWRSAAAGLLLLFLLIPYGAGLLLLAGNERSSCGMPCCNRSKVRCCRKSNKNAHRDGPGWIASSKCPGGCGQLPAVSESAAASLVTARVEVRPIVPVSHVRIQAASPRGSSEIGFALAERPPPSI